MKQQEIYKMAVGVFGKGQRLLSTMGSAGAIIKGLSACYLEETVKGRPFARDLAEMEIALENLRAASPGLEKDVQCWKRYFQRRLLKGPRTQG